MLPIYFELEKKNNNISNEVIVTKNNISFFINQRKVKKKKILCNAMYNKREKVVEEGLQQNFSRIKNTIRIK